MLIKEPSPYVTYAYLVIPTENPRKICFHPREEVDPAYPQTGDGASPPQSIFNRIRNTPATPPRSLIYSQQNFYHVFILSTADLACVGPRGGKFEVRGDEN